MKESPIKELFEVIKEKAQEASTKTKELASDCEMEEEESDIEAEEKKLLQNMSGKDKEDKGKENQSHQQ